MMKNLVLKAINRYSLLQKGDTVTVAFSGGADSVALLHVLCSLKDELGIYVNAAHLNHSIRGQEADRDQAFAQSFCEKLGVTLFSEKLDVPKFAEEKHISLELAARELRYDFLKRVATDKIATAHTASDNLETLIFNLTRGTALKGLCGIPPVRDNIIRPVIFCTREDIENYCSLNGLDYVTDSTNLSDDYSRNKIRHKIIPILKEINQSVEQAALRTTESLTQDNRFLENNANALMFAADDGDWLLCKELNGCDMAVVKRVIKQYFALCYPDVALENQHINEIYNAISTPKAKVNLPSDLYAFIEDGKLFFGDGTQKSEVFTVNITECENVNNLFANNIIDCDKIIGKPIVRTRLEGDKIRLKGSGFTKSLKKLFTENKIPIRYRENLPVIADNNGVIWVHNIGVADRVAICENTKKIIKIEVLSGGNKNE